MKTNLPGMFDFELRVSQLGDKDPLAKLDEVVDWDALRPVLEPILMKEPKAPGGRPRFDLIVMFKVLVLQRLYSLSDAQTEYQIRDRLSFMRFVGVDMHERIPDEKTIWRFREELRTAKVLPKVWKAFRTQLKRLGIQAGTGKIVDASIVETDRSRTKKSDVESNSHTETISEKTDTDAASMQYAARQTDTDATWTAKRKKMYFGYKNHIKVDAATKLIESSVVTTASVHDSQALAELLSEEDAGCQIYADKGYAGMGCRTAVVNVNAQSRILHKAYRNKPITPEQKSENRSWSKLRARVEHIFGYQKTAMRFTRLKTVGFARAEFTIQMNNLVYNLRRMRTLAMAVT